MKNSCIKMEYRNFMFVCVLILIMMTTDRNCKETKLLAWNMRCFESN